MAGFHHWISVWFGWVRDGGLPMVFLLMALESTVVPIPSEIIIPPAAFWISTQWMGGVATSGGSLYLQYFFLAMAGGLGSLLGAFLSYVVARHWGAPWVSRHGRWFGLTEPKTQALVNLIDEHGTLGVFLGRLLPVVRHLISIPAGLWRMKTRSFIVSTLIGSTLWTFCLIYLGVSLLGAHPDFLADPQSMLAALKAESFKISTLVLGFGLLYAFVKFGLLQRRRH